MKKWSLVHYLEILTQVEIPHNYDIFAIKRK